MKLNLLRPERAPPPPKIHAFVAAHYDDEFLDDVAALVERLRGDPRLSAARWSAREHLRTTIHFFLDTTEATRAKLVDLVNELAATASAALEATPPALVRAARLHGLPSPEAAHFVVLDLEDVGMGACLASLQARAEAASVALGYQARTRAPAPFLKLGRASMVVDVSGLAEEARALGLGCLSAISLHVSSAVQDGNVHNRYDRILTVPTVARDGAT